eukprot:s1299_g1.t1
MNTQGCKKCSLCGGHRNIRTCPLPGAAKARAAFAALRAKNNSEKSRKLRGTGPAALSRKPARNVKQKSKGCDPKRHAARQRKLYSGDKLDHSRRVDRKVAASVVDTMDVEKCVQKLMELGFLQKPDFCPSCQTGGLHGCAPRPGVSELQRFWRCDSCRAWCNVLVGCKWLTCKDRFRSLTPARVLHTVTSYCKTQCPRRQSMASTMGPEGPKVVQAVLDCLRSIEAATARKEQSKMHLKNDVEVDATSLRTFRIGPNSQAFKEEITQWRHPKRQPREINVAQAAFGYFEAWFKTGDRVAP